MAEGSIVEILARTRVRVLATILVLRIYAYGRCKGKYCVFSVPLH